MTKLSIIIPHYNSSGMLKKLLDSIPETKDIQVIVVDDNSTEDISYLEQIVKQRENVSCYKNETGKNSAGRCRNIALKHAIGQWVIFADADDYFLEGFMDTVKTYYETDADIVYFMPTSVDLKNGGLSNRHESFASLVSAFLEKGDHSSELLLRYYQEGPISKMIRRDMIEEHNIFFDEIMVANDVMFSIRCAYYAGKITASKDVIYCITKGAGGLTANKKKENYYTRLHVFIDKYTFLRRNLDKNDWIFLDFLGEHYIKLAKAYQLNTWEIIKVYGLFLVNGVRPMISRKWTMRKLIQKIRRYK